MECEGLDIPTLEKKFTNEGVDILKTERKEVIVGIIGGKRIGNGESEKRRG